MSHHIQLTTRDGQQIAFDCEDGEDLVSAAARSTILLPAICKSGGCGTCRAHHTGGAHQLGECSSEALPAEARARGEVLLCRTIPLADMTLSASFDHAHVSFQPIPERMATLAELKVLGGNTLRLVLTLEEDPELGSAAEFEPGQYAELTTPDGFVRRAYSIANTANWEGRLEFLIHLQPKGLFSGYLDKRATIGDRLRVRGPQGAFVLQDNGNRPRCFVAGGTGLAPMLSMLRRMVEFGETQPATLLFGVTSESNLFECSEIADLQAQLPQLKVDICVWKPGAGWFGFVGTPVDALRQHLEATAAKPDIYLCGPPAMIDAAEKAAQAAGVQAAQVYSERFLPT
jgi:ferredoxin-NADP reductase/ferredoxin